LVIKVAGVVMVLRVIRVVGVIKGASVEKWGSKSYKSYYSCESSQS
jgi:hypothetical protein